MDPLQVLNIQNNVILSALSVSDIFTEAQRTELAEELFKNIKATMVALNNQKPEKNDKLHVIGS